LRQSNRLRAEYLSQRLSQLEKTHKIGRQSSAMGLLSLPDEDSLTSKSAPKSADQLVCRDVTRPLVPLDEHTRIGGRPHQV